MDAVFSGLDIVDPANPDRVVRKYRISRFSPSMLRLGVMPPHPAFSPFIVDASATLAKRALRGVKITNAHREHYYQRLILMGWGHRNVALVDYVLMLGVGISALAVSNQHSLRSSWLFGAASTPC